MNEPTTAAGRALLERRSAFNGGKHASVTLPSEQWNEAILAIEAEARAAALEPVFDALTSEDEIRAESAGALDAKPEALRLRERVIREVTIAPGWNKDDATKLVDELLDQQFKWLRAALRDEIRAESAGGLDVAGYWLCDGTPDATVTAYTRPVLERAMTEGREAVTVSGYHWTFHALARLAEPTP